MQPQEIADEIKRRFDCEVKIESRACGIKKFERYAIYARIDRKDFREFIKYLFDIQDYPHFSCISSSDLGERIELLYHFTVDYAKRKQEKIITVCVSLSKKFLRMESITDLIPGAQISEREIHEMVGVEFTGLRDTRHFFLPDDWPEGKYPWRRDETFPENMLNKLHVNWKNGDDNE